jgi:uncharacterized protein YjbI with pentapeptide repeats
MNDETRLALDDAETPVNPYSLLAAVNASARSAGVAWLIFLGLMAYILIAVASVTHRDLLIAGDVTLPLLQVRIGLIRFFLLVPILFVLLHVGLLGKLALLARKTLEFDAAVRLLESTDQRSHPLRLELDNFFLVQVIAGPDRSRVVSAFLNSLTWLTLVIFPLALLLYVQVAFLPFHDTIITMVHRLAVLADVVLLLLMGVFLARPDVTYFGALWRTAVLNPGSLTFAMIMLLAAALVSAVATVPGEANRDSRLGFLIGPDGTLFGVFPRNLDVSDADLVAAKDIAPEGRSINLRGRDLRLARLDRVGLQRADLTGANLDGASLAGADLRHIRLACEERTDLRRSENRHATPCASARGANFAKARLAGAQMSGLDIRGARLEGAQLEGANLANAQMTGVDFSRADLQRADLSGRATLQGANFEQANLQGADLSGARLQMADFTGAALQGATLALANLEGAVLRDAALDGAGLQGAKLFGADMRGARLHFADMSKALVWRTLPPGGDSALSADMTSMAVSPPSEEDMARMRSVVEGLEAGPAKVRLAGLMAPPNDAGPNSAWSGSPEALAWNSLARVSEAGMADGYRARITEQLARLICRPRFGDGAVAAGIARRAGEPGFKGDAAALYDRVKGADCPASATISPQIIRDLAAAADAARGQ